MPGLKTIANRSRPYRTRWELARRGSNSYVGSPGAAPRVAVDAGPGTGPLPARRPNAEPVHQRLMHPPARSLSPRPPTLTLAVWYGQHRRQHEKVRRRKLQSPIFPQLLCILAKQKPLMLLTGRAVRNPDRTEENLRMLSLPGGGSKRRRAAPSVLAGPRLIVFQSLR